MNNNNTMEKWSNHTRHNERREYVFSPHDNTITVTCHNVEYYDTSYGEDKTIISSIDIDGGLFLSTGGVLVSTDQHEYTIGTIVSPTWVGYKTIAIVLTVEKNK